MVLSSYVNIARQAQDFLEQGYTTVEIPSLMPVPTRFLKTFDGLIRDAERLGAAGEVKARKSSLVDMQGNGWSWGCDHIFAPALRRQALLDLVNLPPLPEILNAILGPRMRLSGGHGHWSPENYDYFLHWHRDTRPERWRFRNSDPRAHVQVCLALRDERVVRIVPGSHLLDLTEADAQWIVDCPHERHPREVIPTISAGSALLLNTCTLHRAQCSSQDRRRSLHFGFTRVGATPEPGRRPKHFTWMADPKFLEAQSPFIRACLEEQAAFTAKESLCEH